MLYLGWEGSCGHRGMYIGPTLFGVVAAAADTVGEGIAEEDIVGEEIVEEEVGYQ